MEGGYLISDGDRIVDCSAGARRVVEALVGAHTEDGVVGARTSTVFEAAGLADRQGEFSVVLDGDRRHFEVLSTPRTVPTLRRSGGPTEPGAHHRTPGIHDDGRDRFQHDS